MRVDWSIPARNDLRAINDWLTSEASADQAIRILATIRSRSKFLVDFPRGGRPHRGGSRILRVFDTPYLIRYQVVGDVVSVMRVHHEREDWFIEG
jgi:toxin ParE1/3/4